MRHRVGHGLAENARVEKEHGAGDRGHAAGHDGEQLAAWWIPAPASVPARGTVLLFHGNAGNISHRIDYAKMFFDMGYDTLLVDYRGYGESSGEPSNQGIRAERLTTLSPTRADTGMNVMSRTRSRVANSLNSSRMCSNTVSS